MSTRRRRSTYRAPLTFAGLIPGSACPGARLSKYHDPELGARLSFASVADSCRSFGAGAVPAFLTRSALARFSARTRALACSSGRRSGGRQIWGAGANDGEPRSIEPPVPARR